MKIPSPGTPVCVSWKDAETVAPGWVYDSDPDFSEAAHLTYGVLRGVSKDAVQIAQTVAVEDGNITSWLSILEIPRGCIRRVERLG